MTGLEKYYNKFNEDKRLKTRHGTVEFLTSMKYIREYLTEFQTPKILDIGAGTGRYSVQLANEGYDVTAVELVRYNLGILKKKGSTVKAYQGNATNLKRFCDETFDLTLLFGPMYHLGTLEERIKALKEAERVTKPGGVILVAYIMNDYSVLTYGFVENHMKECMEAGMLSDDFHIQSAPEELYHRVRLEDIEQINAGTHLERIKIIAADGPANYMRPVLNAMDEETFQLFLQYHMATCERPDLMGASAHTVDILRRA